MTKRIAESPRTRDASVGALYRAATGILLLATVLRLVHLWQIRRAPFFSILIGDGLRYDAWAIPRFAICVSPKKKVCSVKNDGMILYF